MNAVVEVQLEWKYMTESHIEEHIQTKRVHIFFLLACNKKEGQAYE